MTCREERGQLQDMNTFRYIIPGLLILTASASGEPLRLQQITLEQWNSRIAETKTRVSAETEHPEKFLAVDRSPQLRERVRRGEIVVDASEGKGTESVPSGLIHDWTGSVFIPETDLASILKRVQSYHEYASIYRPSIVSARLLSRHDDEFTFSFLLAQRVKFIDSALDGDFHSTFQTVGAARAYSFTESTRLQEINNYGHADAKRYPPDSGSGLIWRLASVARYEEADGGVYIELQGIALSRPIPAGLHWIVGPLVNRISRAAITVTLRQTRAVGSTTTTNAPDEILPLAFR
jgi:hypothetical protein